MPEKYCRCCDLPSYSCSRLTDEERATAAAEARSSTPHPDTTQAATVTVVRATTLTTRTKRAWTPVPRSHNYPALCVNERCRRRRDNGEPNPRDTGGRSNLCHVCEDRVRDNLNDVAGAWEDLKAALSGALHHDGDRVHGSPSPGIILDEDVQRAAAAIEESLTFYGRLIRDERGAPFPLATPTVPELARWIGRTHLPWLAAHPDPEVSASLASDAYHARRLTFRHAYETKPRRIQLPFRCRETLDTGTMCLALMHTTLHPSRDTMPDLVCDEGHTIEPSVWMRGTWQHAPIDAAALTALVRAITSHAVHSSETTEGTP